MTHDEIVGTFIAYQEALDKNRPVQVELSITDNGCERFFYVETVHFQELFNQLKEFSIYPVRERPGAPGTVSHCMIEIDPHTFCPRAFMDFEGGRYTRVKVYVD